MHKFILNQIEEIHAQNKGYLILLINCESYIAAINQFAPQGIVVNQFYFFVFCYENIGYFYS